MGRRKEKRTQEKKGLDMRVVTEQKDRRGAVEEGQVDPEMHGTTEKGGKQDNTHALAPGRAGLMTQNGEAARHGSGGADEIDVIGEVGVGKGGKET